MEGSQSAWLPVTSGVPQGSILGPFMFLLYINDIVDCTSGKIRISLFADDTKIWSSINNIEDASNLQLALNNLGEWAKAWGMSFNIKKCNVMSFKQSIMYEYKMCGEELHVQGH